MHFGKGFCYTVAAINGPDPTATINYRVLNPNPLVIDGSGPTSGPIHQARKQPKINF